MQSPLPAVCERPARAARFETGAILLLAMVFMLLLALVAAAVIQGATLQLRLAGNDQFQAEAAQAVRAVATQLSIDLGNFSLDGDVGFTRCAATGPAADCDSADLLAPFADALPGVVAYRIVRQDPLRKEDLMLREAQSVASSTRFFDAAIFEVEVDIDGSATGLARARIVRGVARRMPVER